MTSLSNLRIELHPLIRTQETVIGCQTMGNDRPEVFLMPLFYNIPRKRDRDQAISESLCLILHILLN